MHFLCALTDILKGAFELGQYTRKTDWWPSLSTSNDVIGCYVTSRYNKFLSYSTCEGKKKNSTLHFLTQTIICTLHFVTQTIISTLHFLTQTIISTLHFLTQTIISTLHFLTQTIISTLHFLTQTIISTLHFLTQTIISTLHFVTQKIITTEFDRLNRNSAAVWACTHMICTYQ